MKTERCLILDIDIVKGFMRMCNDGWLQGWHERNGGNLTYRMKEEEVAQCRPFFDPQPFDIAFGLAHTIEKSAEIYVKVLSMGGGLIRQTITDDNLRAIARDFGVTLNEDFLD